MVVRAKERAGPVDEARLVSIFLRANAGEGAGWHKLVTTPPFAIGKPFVRQPRGDTRVTPEDKRRAVAQRAAEIAERRAVFDANNNN